LDKDIIKNRKAIVMAVTDFGKIGPMTFQQLLMRLGAPEDFLHAIIEDLSDISQLKDEQAGLLLESLEKIDEYTTRLEYYKSLGINVVTFLDDDYPVALREISDPPPILYYKGEYSNIDINFIALVGTTVPSQAGIRFSVDLAKAIVDNGYGVISGLAAGIDSAAHLGVLKAGGITTAVLGCGFEKIYPAENEPLVQNILNSGGLLISEIPPGDDVTKQGLITRNRLISALSKAVIVVEIGEKSQGELITAKYAQKQARPIFYGNPENNLNYETIEDIPGVIIYDNKGIDEIMKYIV
jgi:DNA processing protein